MNASEDPQLRKLLGKWPGNAPLPPRFQEGVWRKLAMAEHATSAPSAFSFIAWLGIWFTQPAFAPVCVTVLLLAGLGTGYFWAGHDTARWEAQLSNRYAASINPYATVQP